LPMTWSMPTEAGWKSKANQAWVASLPSGCRLQSLSPPRNLKSPIQPKALGSLIMPLRAIRGGNSFLLQKFNISIRF
jgi:hypothetical protein